MPTRSPPARTSRLKPAAGLLHASVALVSICVALGAVSALETRHMSVTHGLPIPWRLVLASTMPRWLLLAALLPLALLVGVRQALRRLRARDAMIHLLIFGAISLAHALVMAWTMGYAAPVSLLFPWSARVLRSWYSGLPLLVSLYGAVLATAWAISEARERERRALRAAELEAQLQAATLAALRARLRPHFLYNTLHGIAALVADMQPARAVTAIEHLSELLHASLRDDDRSTITLHEEVGLAERYLALQRMRFGERLQYDIDVADDARDAAVPVLLLQPLVENAVVHGLEAGLERLHIGISAARVSNELVVDIENDGRTYDPAARSGGHGVGLPATRARLATAYGDDASLQLLPRDAGGVIVRMTLPFATAVDTAGAPLTAAR